MAGVKQKDDSWPCDSQQQPSASAHSSIHHKGYDDHLLIHCPVVLIAWSHETSHALRKSSLLKDAFCGRTPWHRLHVSFVPRPTDVALTYDQLYLIRGETVWLMMAGGESTRACNQSAGPCVSSSQREIVRSERRMLCHPCFQTPTVSLWQRRWLFFSSSQFVSNISSYCN